MPTQPRSSGLWLPSLWLATCTELPGNTSNYRCRSVMGLTRFSGGGNHGTERLSNLPGSHSSEGAGAPAHQRALGAHPGPGPAVEGPAPGSRSLVAVITASVIPGERGYRSEGRVFSEGGLRRRARGKAQLHGFTSRSPPAGPPGLVGTRRETADHSAGRNNRK